VLIWVKAEPLYSSINQIDFFVDDYSAKSIDCSKETSGLGECGRLQNQQWWCSRPGEIPDGADICPCETIASHVRCSGTDSSWKRIISESEMISYGISGSFVLFPAVKNSKIAGNLTKLPPWLEVHVLPHGVFIVAYSLQSIAVFPGCVNYMT